MICQPLTPPLDLVDTQTMGESPLPSTQNAELKLAISQSLVPLQDRPISDLLHPPIWWTVRDWEKSVALRPKMPNGGRLPACRQPPAPSPRIYQTRPVARPPALPHPRAQELSRRHPRLQQPRLRLPRVHPPGQQTPHQSDNSQPVLQIANPGILLAHVQQGRRLNC